MSNAQRATFAHLQHRLHTNGSSPNPVHPLPQPHSHPLMQPTLPFIPTLPYAPLNPHLIPAQTNPSPQPTGILGSVAQAFGDIQGASTYALPMQQYPPYNWNQTPHHGANQQRQRGHRGGHRNRDSHWSGPRNIHKSNPQTGQGETGEDGAYDQQKDDEYFCDPCDKSFRSKSQYETHIEKHVPCEHEGCKFAGIPKALDSHKELMHSLSRNIEPKRKMMPLETPEEIQKYIEERKKNFPTKENVLKKEEAMKAKVEQGGLDTNSKKKRNFNDDIRNRGKKRNRQPFTGVDKSEPEVQKSTAHLNGDYEEGEVDEDEAVHEKEGNSDIYNQTEQSTNKAICRFMRRGHCRRGKRCNFSHDIPNDKINKPKNANIQTAKTQNTSNEANARKSLLEKLLEPEIKHEISIILQAIRHLNKAGLLVEN